MSYIVKQKIKGNIYLYNVENKWDSVNKKTFQKRTYIGAENPIKLVKKRRNGLSLVNKNFGNIFLLKCLSEKIGIDNIVKNCFPEDYNEIMAMVYYEVMEGSPTYLFQYWLEEHHLPEVKKLDSAATSNLFESIGKNEISRVSFTEYWIEHLKPLNALFFDISSVSSYSTNISFIEWGYNRDQENLAQLNIGVVYCEEKKLPVCYFLYPGSIVDVTTLKNCQKYLNKYGLKDFLFILDRGFFSTANILEMNNAKNKINFIQPLSFGLKKTKELIQENKHELRHLNSAFAYNDELLYHLKSSICFDSTNFDAHLFYNEKAEMDVRHNFLLPIFEIEKKLKDTEFKTLKTWTTYKNNNMVEKYRDFFKWNKSTGRAVRNIRKINAHLSRTGYYVMATNQTAILRDELLSHYRNKDLVEKVFDILKNEMDGKRLRTHNDYTTQGKIFLLFISVILCSEITKIMNQKELFKTFTVKELMYELRKIKINNIAKDGKPIVSEISKKQRKIFEDFEIDINQVYGY